MGSLTFAGNQHVALKLRQARLGRNAPKHWFCNAMQAARSDNIFAIVMSIFLSHRWRHLLFVVISVDHTLPHYQRDCVRLDSSWRKLHRILVIAEGTQRHTYSLLLTHPRSAYVISRVLPKCKHHRACGCAAALMPLHATLIESAQWSRRIEWRIGRTPGTPAGRSTSTPYEAHHPPPLYARDT